MPVSSPENKGIAQKIAWSIAVTAQALSLISFLTDGIRVAGSVTLHWPLFLLFSAIPFGVGLQFSMAWIKCKGRAARFKDIGPDLSEMKACFSIIKESRTGEELLILHPRMLYYKERFKGTGIPTPPVPDIATPTIGAVEWIAFLNLITPPSTHGNWRYAKREAKSFLKGRQV